MCITLQSALSTECSLYIDFYVYNSSIANVLLMCIVILFMCITLQSALSLVSFMYINLSSALNSDLVQYRRALALRVFFLKKT